MSKQTKIILFSCMYIAGIVSFLSGYTVYFFIGTVLILLFLYLRNKLFTARYLLLLLSVFVLGIFNSFINLKYDDDLTVYDGEDVEAIAKVISLPSNNKKDKTNFYARVTSVKTNKDSKYGINSKSVVTINGDEKDIKQIKIGDKLKLKGRLKVPVNSQNPSQFDYARYLQYKKTFSMIYVSENPQIISRSSDITGKILRNFNDTRNKILNIHAQNIKSPMLEILGGIIFGDDAVNPDEDIKTSFINSGIIHILAASGMNVTLIFGIWLFFAGNLRLNYKFSILTGIALILFYTCMTGFGPPIIRASLMLILILIGKLIDRQTPTMALLFLVAFLMLIFNPLMVFDVGFQLSFTVTFALILSAPLLTFNFKHKMINYILGSCLIPVIAQLYAAPLQMFYFNTFTIYSIFANIAIIPVLSIVSFAGFISSILALIAPIANKVCFCADIILNPLLIYIVKVAKFFSHLPYSVIYLPKPSVLQIFIYFLIITSVICILRFKMYSKKAAVSIAITILIFVLTLIPQQSKNPEIIFFAVGNSDAILLKSDTNDYFLTDTGKMPYLSSTSPARKIILEYLKDKGIKQLSALVLSHFDADHAGGTVDILKDIKVSTVYLPEADENTELSNSIKEYIAENKINSEIITSEKQIYNNPDFVLTLFSPKGNAIKSENQKSLILHGHCKNYNFLLMGDGDINSYNTLPDEYKHNLTVMKTGHHGAKGTINNYMADNTDIFVISTGPNVYNHPHPDTMNVIEKSGKTCLRTDRYNAVKIIFTPKKPEILVFSPRTRQFVKYQ